MNLIKPPVAGELTWHKADLYCVACKRVTEHDVHFAKIDPDDGRILANAWCQRNRKHKDISDSQWQVTVYEWVCRTYQCLSLTKDQWLHLVAGNFSGGGHRRRS